jgi:DNA-directed RNA polymerase specialized sigma subunit
MFRGRRSTSHEDEQVDDADILASSVTSLGSRHYIDPEEQIATRAAWLYFVAGLTQAQIGKKLGINRTRVNRVLAQWLIAGADLRRKEEHMDGPRY